MQPRLSELTAAMRSDASRFAPGHLLQALVASNGSLNLALSFAESKKSWLAQTAVLGSIKAATGGSVLTDFAGAVPGAVASAFLNQVRDAGLLGQLPPMRRALFGQRIFVSAAGASAAEVAEGAAVPASQGAWQAIFLRPRRFAGLTVQARELVLAGDAAAQLALSEDLAAAVAAAHDRAFISPDASASVLTGQVEITATGTTAAQLDADLRGLLDAVPTAHRDGVFIMPQTTAAFLATVRGTSGVRSFPDIGAGAGGQLLGLQVAISSALGQAGSPPTNAIALVSPGQILYAADDRVALSVSRQATIEMLDNPTNDAAAGTATSMVSLFQTEAVAAIGEIRADWFARSGAASFVRVGF